MIEYIYYRTEKERKMKYTLIKKENSIVEALVEVEAAEWKDAQSKAFKKVASKIKVDGFRPGKAPEAMLRARVNPNDVVNRAVNEILDPAFRFALKEGKFTPFERPSVEVTELTDKGVKVKFVFAITPEVKLGAYTGLAGKKETPSVSDEEVNADINARLEKNADLVLVDREARLGDTVVLDFKGYVDGKAFEGGEAKNYELVLGSNSFVPGFEEQLVGVKSEEQKEVNITFPEQYVDELKGKPAKFVCKIHEIKEKQIPALDDEAVADMNIKDVKTVEELKEHTKKTLLEKKVNDAENAYVNDLIEQIVAKSEVEVADAIIEREAKANEENLKKNVEANGLTIDQYLQIVGQTKEELAETMKKDALNNLRHYLVIEALAAKEKLNVTNAEVDFELSKLAESYKMKLEDVKKALSGQLDSYRTNLRNKKIHDFLKANNK